MHTATELLDETQQGKSVEAGRLEEGLPPGGAEVGGVVAVADAGTRDDVADERVAVGVQSAGGDRDHGVTVLHHDPRRGWHPPRPRRWPHPRRRSRAGPSSPGCSAVSPPTSAGARRRARFGDAAHDVGDALGNDLAAGDVVGHEERLRAHHDDVVDHHADQVLPIVSCLSIACAIATFVPTPSVLVASSGRRKSRSALASNRAGEPADTAEHFGAVRRAHGRLHQLDGEITCSGVDAGFGIGIGGGGSHAPSLPPTGGPTLRRETTSDPDALPAYDGAMADKPQWLIREDASVPVLVALALRQQLGIRAPEDLPALRDLAVRAPDATMPRPRWRSSGGATGT